MDKREPLIVWQNGKKTELKRVDKPLNETKYEQLNQHRDQHGLDAHTIPEIARQTERPQIKKQINKGNNKRRNHAKPTLIAVVSAIFIGLILGFFMLHIFSGSNDNLAHIPSQSPLTDQNKEDQDEGNNESTFPFAEEMDAYVLQAGVFSEEINAKQWAKTYEQANHPTMIWERDNHFFLLVGLTQTNEQAMVEAKKLETYEFELFVKEWTTNPLENTLSDSEKSWVDDFQDQWYRTLQSISEGEKITQSEWFELLDKIPSESDTLAKLVNELNLLLKDDLEIENNAQTQVLLLNMWKKYEDFVK